jgi:hypothetical protein
MTASTSQVLDYVAKKLMAMLKKEAKMPVRQCRYSIADAILTCAKTAMRQLAAPVSR